MGVCIFVFRRDLRIHDNTAFIEAVKNAVANNWQILPVFIFNNHQIDPSKNKYHGNPQVQFMVQSINDLGEDLVGKGGKLVFFHVDDDVEVLRNLRNKLNIAAVAFNADVTPYARRRDAAIKSWCEQENIRCIAMEDYTMLPIEKVQTKTGKTYEVFTPFYRKAIHIKVADPVSCPESIPWVQSKVLGDLKMNIDNFYTYDPRIQAVGGRKHALEILKGLKRGEFKSYKNQRDVPAKRATTGLSPYIKFGCISIREAHATAKEAMGRGSILVQQLFWREFYYNIAYSFPEVLKGQIDGKQHNMFVHGKFEKNKWNTENADFQKWARGQTGIPIVDAAMRCMNTTGWMHNRLRMVVAMFLVRYLNIDWRKGEQYFAQKLVDYDAVNNNQGWCWAVSYRRQLNPYKQTGRFDPDALFIKEWVPELENVPVLDIIMWWDRHTQHADAGYPPPMITIQGYRVKLKRYISNYVRPKNTNTKKKKTSKYAGNQKNKEKYKPKSAG